MPPLTRPFALPWPPLRQAEPSVALRPWGATPTDPDVLAGAWVDPEVARWTKVPAEPSPAAAARWIDGEAARRDVGKALDLVITPLGEPDTIIGEVGLVLVEPEKRWAEVGYWLLPAWRGSGRATVALDLFSDWVLREQSVARLFARVQAANPASGAVAERAGYQRAGELPDGIVVWMRDPETAPGTPVVD